MRIAFTEYTNSASVPVRMVYRCSKCGHENERDQYVTASASYTDQMAFGSDTMSRRDRESKMRVSEEINDRLKTVYSSISPDDFYRLNLHGRCDKCGYNEPWSHMKSTAFLRLMIVSVIVAVVFGILLIMFFANPNSKVTWGLLFIIGMLAASIGVIIAYFVRIKILKSKITKIKYEDLPRFYPKEKR